VRRSLLPLLLSLIAVVPACSSILGETPTNSSPTTGDNDSPSSTETTESPDPKDCVRLTGGIDHVDTGALASDALLLSGETFVCADDVVVTDPGDLNHVAAAAQLAAALNGPLLFPEPRLSAELGRLKPIRVHIIGAVSVNTPSDSVVVSHDLASASEYARGELGVGETVPTPAKPDASTIVETVRAIVERDRVVRPQTDPTGTTSVNDPFIDPGEVVEGLALPTESEILWIVDATRPETILLAAAIGRSVGATVVAIDGNDVLGHPALGIVLASHPTESFRFVGAAPDASEWELNILINGQQVPGGGYYILPEEEKRRYVAFYGHPETTALGALGEQGPEETLTRMAGYLEAYSGDGSRVIPVFEMIASVASAGPTDDGDYSYEWPIETFDEWVRVAEENGVYVILDLQSGRDHFLSQAKQYEEMLKKPFVGLALDPEWRLGPDQVHLRQVGTVEAAELNEVVNWVADLVRDNGLPQKMMLVHQFRTAMIQNRQDLVQRPEIQLIVQMDGDGTEPQKDATLAAITKDTLDAHWGWGWKNFFDEDEPGPPTPESTMGKSPSPVYVSYQ
jgi:hypothetical protein